MSIPEGTVYNSSYELNQLNAIYCVHRSLLKSMLSKVRSKGEWRRTRSSKVHFVGHRQWIPARDIVENHAHVKRAHVRRGAKITEVRQRAMCQPPPQQRMACAGEKWKEPKSQQGLMAKGLYPTCIGPFVGFTFDVCSMVPLRPP